jgi:ParB family chromosome partitioning protein
MSTSALGALLEIPCDQIYVGQTNVRKREVLKGIDELKESIRRLGLLQPIIVIKQDDRYELIVGQRRFEAVRELGWPKIPALVVGKMDTTRAMIASLSENIHRRELPYRDMVDACDILYEKYGSVPAVAQELGVSDATVMQYLAHRLVPEPVKKMVEEGKISRQDAAKVARATLPSILEGNLTKAVELAEEVAKMPREVKGRAIEIAEDHPEMPTDVVLKEAKKPPERIRVVVHLPEKYGVALSGAAKDLAMEPEEVAKTAVVDWLTARGYVS